MASLSLLISIIALIIALSVVASNFCAQTALNPLYAFVARPFFVCPLYIGSSLRSPLIGILGALMGAGPLMGAGLPTTLSPSAGERVEGRRLKHMNQHARRYGFTSYRYPS